MKTTKQLARELGIIKRRSLAVRSEKKASSRQTFSYLIVIDFESTCWQDGKFRTQEIIEFPAVLLNTFTGKIENEFQFYIQPQEQPVLSDFCKQLTGITQEQVDNGIPLYLCIRKFMRWLEMLKETKAISFSQTGTGNLATMVTWSDWDLGVCLFNELRRKQIRRPSELNCWIDLRATYRKFYSRKPNGLNGALKDLGIDFEGREHSGLHDSRNTAWLAYRMIQDGCIMNITKTLKGTNSHQKIIPTCIKPLKTLTPTKSPAHKRKKANDELDLDDSLDHAISSSQEIDILLTDLASNTPERKRKNRVSVHSPGVKVSMAISRLQSGPNCFKVRARRTGKFDPADIYMDPEDSTEMFTKSINQNQKLSEVSVNVPLPTKTSKATPSKLNKDMCKQKLSSPSRKNTSHSFFKGSPLKGVLISSEQKTGHIQFPICVQRNGNKLKDMSEAPNRSITSHSNSTSPQHREKQFKVPSPPVLAATASCSKMEFKTPQNSPLKTVYRTPCATPSNALPGGQHESAVKGPINRTNTSSSSRSSIITPCSNMFRTPSSLRTPHVGSTFTTPLSASKSSCNNNTFKSSCSSTGNTSRTPCGTISSFCQRTPCATSGTFQTPSTNSFINPSGMKGTPPLCKCGKRSKRRTAQTPGPNLGRTFFTCGSSTYNQSTGERIGCGFFKWEMPCGSNGKTQSFTQNGTLSKPFVPVFNSGLNSTQKRNLGVRSHTLSKLR